jgi:uncharacterized protein YrrD
VNSKQLKGLAVISIKDGEKLGTIDQVFVDAGAKRIVGFAVRHGGGRLFPSVEEQAPELIDVDDVHAVGPDAVTLSDKGAIRGDQTRARLDQLMNLDDLTKLKTVTEGGTALGTVASAEVDDRSFALRELEVSAGFFASNRHLPIGQVVSIGHDLVVVDDAVAADESGTTPLEGDADERRFVVGDVKPTQ